MSISNRFRSHCRVLRIATLTVFIGLSLLLGLGLAGMPWLLPAKGTASGTMTLLAVVRFLPGFGYLYALWAVQKALDDLAAGRLFRSAMGRTIRHIGVGVLVGALLNVFAVTNLSRWILGGRGSYVYFDLSGIVLGVVGAALVLLSRLVDEARALQEELDEIV